jgi:hypothetical protein
LPMNSAKDDPKGPGFPIRKSTDQRVLAPPRSLSQRATSFVASVRQGIHQMPLKRLIQRNLVTSRDKSGVCPRANASTIAPTQYVRLDFKTRQEPPTPRSAPAKAGTPEKRQSLSPKNSDPRCQTTTDNPSPGARISISKDECKSALVEADGIEPTTSCLQSTRSPN